MLPQKEPSNEQISNVASCPGIDLAALRWTSAD